MRFHNKSVLVTGGATGIGLAIARRFAEEGACVIIVGRREDVGRQTEKALQEEGLRVQFLKGDVSVEEDVKAFMAQAVELHGGLDILVNNAAAFFPVKFLEGETKEWHSIFNLIVNGVYFCSRTAAKHMVAVGIKGRIINVSSINAYRALEESSHYNSAKGAVDQLTRCMAMELAEHGIHVNGVGPGFVETPMSVVDGVKEHETEWFKSIYVERKKIPLQRPGQPEEIAGVVAFLASKDATYICGVTIPVDGGLSITF